jgi:N-acetylglucosamine-6-sulfatase
VADDVGGMWGPRGKIAIVSVLLCALMAPATGALPRAAGAARTNAVASRPNILLIVSDDQAWSTFSRALMPSVYGDLVDHGVLFKRAYIDTPLCCPSRAQILTGLYEHNTGVDANEVALDRPTFPMALHDAGYRTMLAGKYLNSWPCEPRSEFDRWVCVSTPAPSSNSLVDPYMNVDGEWQRFSGYQPDILAAKAEDFIADTPASRPFFVMYTPTTPHPPADDPRYDSMPVSPPRGPAFDVDTMTPSNPKFARRPALTPGEIAISDQKYASMAHATRSFDDAVGSLVSSLGDRSRDTIVIYISDNGFLYGEHRRFGKTDPWEESVKVPMVVRYPAVHAEDRPVVSEALVQNVDIAATVADLAGFRWGADGTSFLPVLQGSGHGGRSAALIENCRGVSRGELACSGLTFDGGTADAPGFEGIVTDRYKYVEFDDGSRQLIDLKTDPHELRNLHSRIGLRPLERNLVTRLHAMMRSRLQTTIASGPSRLATRGAQFSYFSPSRTATYRCRLTKDGSALPWRACPGGSVAYSRLADGEYVFEVAGISEAGRIDPNPASRRFTVSTRGGPDITLSTHPPISQTDPTASFSYTSSTPGAGFRCWLVPLGEVPCDGSGVQFHELAEGTYRFEVWAKDPATAAVSDPGVGWDFRIDTTGPTMAFTAAPHRSTQRREAAFRFAPDETVVGPIRCAIGGKVVDCSKGRLIVGSLSRGPHQLVITARDQLGNLGRTTYGWTIDQEAPSVRITAGPPRRSAGTSATFFLLSSEQPSLFECKLDNLPVMPCFEAQRLSDLGVGAHVFAVWSIDGAMNRSVADLYRWTIR